MLPATIEWGAGSSGDDVVRVRFEGNHETARALFRILRWGAGAGDRARGASGAVDLEGRVPALRLPLAGGGELVLVFVGNRLLASRGGEALVRLFSGPASPGSGAPPAAPHGFPREDGHGWTEAASIGEGCRVRFSLLLESDDLMRFRAAPESGCPDAIDEAERDALARRLRDEAERIVLAAGLEPTEAPVVGWTDGGRWTVAGRVAGVRERTLRAVLSVASRPGQLPPDAGR
jgi:hypothetical protein